MKKEIIARINDDNNIEWDGMNEEITKAAEEAAAICEKNYKGEDLSIGEALLALTDQVLIQLGCGAPTEDGCWSKVKLSWLADNEDAICELEKTIADKIGVELEAKNPEET